MKIRDEKEGVNLCSCLYRSIKIRYSSRVMIDILKPCAKLTDESIDTAHVPSVSVNFAVH